MVPLEVGLPEVWASKIPRLEKEIETNEMILVVDDNQHTLDSLTGCLPRLCECTVIGIVHLSAAKANNSLYGPYWAYVIDGNIGGSRGEPWADELVDAGRERVILYSGAPRVTKARVVEKGKIEELLEILNSS